MFDSCFYQALSVLEPVAPTGAGADDAVSVLAAVRLVRGALDVLEAGVVAARPDVVLDDVRVSGRQARTVMARAETLTAAPELGVALAGGEVTSDHVDAVAAIAKRLEPPVRDALLGLSSDLALQARRSSPDAFSRQVQHLADLLAADQGVGRFERQRRQTALRRGIARNGMHWLRGEFDPETGARLFTALDREIEALFHRPDAHLDATAVVTELAGDPEHLAAHALVHLCTRRATGAPPSGGDVEVSVLVDQQTLAEGLHQHSVCETSGGAALSPATVRKMCCDATILPIVMGAPSVPLDLGRQQRVATKAQRRALRPAHRTCVVPGCSVPFDWCQIHHLLDWLQFGPTDLANLAPVCHRHHHLVHEGGYTLTLDRQRRATFLPPVARANPPPTAATG